MRRRGGRRKKMMKTRTDELIREAVAGGNGNRLSTYHVNLGNRSHTSHVQIDEYFNRITCPRQQQVREREKNAFYCSVSRLYDTLQTTCISASGRECKFTQEVIFPVGPSGRLVLLALSLTLRITRVRE